MDKQITKLEKLLKAKLPQSVIELDAPDQREGNWWIDVRFGKRRVTVDYQPARGFGIYDSDAGFGERPTEIYRTAELAARRLVQLFAAGKSNRLRLTLKDLRELYDCSQIELAQKVGVKQSAISRFEQRSEVKIGTLAAAVKALGGELEVRARFRDSDVPISVKD